MDTGDQRQHPRRQVFSAIMITPNGDHHAAQVVDLSAGGVRTGLPDDWAPRAGTRVRVYFLLERNLAIVLEAEVTRVAVDHLGLQFAPGQDEPIRHLLEQFPAP